MGDINFQKKASLSLCVQQPDGEMNKHEIIQDQPTLDEGALIGLDKFPQL
jgi:hypothetical protein